MEPRASNESNLSFAVHHVRHACVRRSPGHHDCRWHRSSRGLLLECSAESWRLLGRPVVGPPACRDRGALLSEHWFIDRRDLRHCDRKREDHRDRDREPWLDGQRQRRQRPFHLDPQHSRAGKRISDRPGHGSIDGSDPDRARGLRLDWNRDRSPTRHRRNAARRARTRTTSFLGTKLGGIPGGPYLFDFDNGKDAQDSIGQLFGVANLGTGTTEAMLASGDSGGPSFIRTPTGIELAGIHSFIFSPGIPYDVSQATNSSFGEIAGDTRLANYAPWIDSVVAASVPEPRGWALMSAGLIGLMVFARRRLAPVRAMSRVKKSTRCRPIPALTWSLV